MSEQAKRGEFYRLFRSGHLPDLMRGIERAVTQSFDTDAVLRPVKTQDEQKRRVVMCKDLILAMRQEHSLSVQRIVYELPSALRCRLDGAEWQPPTRSSWIEPDTSAPAIR